MRRQSTSAAHLKSFGSGTAQGNAVHSRLDLVWRPQCPVGTRADIEDGLLVWCPAGREVLKRTKDFGRFRARTCLRGPWCPSLWRGCGLVRVRRRSAHWVIYRQDGAGCQREGYRQANTVLSMLGMV